MPVHVLRVHRVRYIVRARIVDLDGVGVLRYVATPVVPEVTVIPNVYLIRNYSLKITVFKVVAVDDIV